MPIENKVHFEIIPTGTPAPWNYQNHWKVQFKMAKVNERNLKLGMQNQR